MEETSFSSSNFGQTQTIIKLLTILSGNFPGSIRVVCLYRGQAKEIGIAASGFPEVVVTTSDGTQGHEADLVLLCTTRSGEDHQVNAEQFWADSARINVAISRGRHGLVIVGDFVALRGQAENDGIWRRIIDEALKMTTVVTPDYVDMMAHPDAYFENNLIKLNNFSPQAYDFYAALQLEHKNANIAPIQQLTGPMVKQAMDRAGGSKFARPPLPYKQQQQTQAGGYPNVGGIGSGGPPSSIGAGNQQFGAGPSSSYASAVSGNSTFRRQQPLEFHRKVDVRSKVCFKCQKPGHLQRNCRQK